MRDTDLVNALRCISSEDGPTEDCKKCPFYKMVTLPEDLAEKVGAREWSACDVDAVGLAAADRIANMNTHILALQREIEKLRGQVEARPYRIGETVYVLLKDGAIFYPETNGWYISEEIIGAISHDGFYLGDPVDDVYTPDSEIGKTVFLTKKAAKAALEAMKDETR